MTLALLKEFKTVQVIEKKERISLIVKCSMNSHLVFYKDRTYQIIDRNTKSALHDGKLDFVPNKNLPSAHKNRVVVIGNGKGGQMLCAVFNLQEELTIQLRQVENTQPEKTTKYHLIQPATGEEEKANLFIVRVQENIENGIAVAVYDFWRGLWCEQMIALSSNFLTYKLVPTCASDHLYKQPMDLSCHSFALVSSLGQRLDSIHCSKIKFCHQLEGGEYVLKIKFIITRELRLKKQITIVGGQQIDQNHLFIIGNIRRETTNPQEAKNSPAYIALNTGSIENNLPQEPLIVSVNFGRQVNKQSFLIRSLIGVLGQDLIVTLHLPFGKVGIAKLSSDTQEICFQGDSKTGSNPYSYQLSASHDCFYRYELDCEPFFQKIKKAPSKISYNLIKIYDKSAQYTHLLKSAFPQFESFFIKDVLSLL